MAKGNHLGIGGFKKGVAANPSGLRKGTTVSANNFKDECFDLYKTNKAKFHTAVLCNDRHMMDFMRMLSSFVPKEVDLGKETIEALKVTWQK